MRRHTPSATPGDSLIRILGRFALCAFVVMACEAAASADCAVDGDCKSGRVCRAGSCVAPCAVDKDCPGELVCSGGACVDSTAVKVTPPPVASDTPRLVRRMQLQQELSDLRRKSDDNHWITDYVVGGAVGIGLVGLGAILNAALPGIVGGDAGNIAAYWTFFGCALGGGITFAVLATVATVKLIQWTTLQGKIDAKRRQLERFDAAASTSAITPPMAIDGDRAQILTTVLRF